MSEETAKRLRETIKWFTLSEELIVEGQLVLVAVSGGPDSMALLSALRSLSPDLDFRVAVGYFDHRIRETSEHDFVKAHAKKLGASFYAGAADVPALAKESSDSIEEAARKARYAWLHELAGRIGADRIATGHTQDDQAETVLMRVLRGTGVRGLSGIPVRRGKVIRPLLCLTRADAAAYCLALGIDVEEDPTNLDRRFLRNRIRHELMPLLESNYLGGIRDNLLRLSLNAREVVDEIRSRTQPLVAQNLKQTSGDEWVLNVARIAKLESTSLFVLFGDIFANELGDSVDLSRSHYENLARLIKDSRASGKSLDLPGVSVKREYEKLIITRARPADSDFTVSQRATLTLPGNTHAAGVAIACEILKRSQVEGGSLKATENTAYFDLQRLKLPLTLRNPETGDRMHPFGMTGTKKLSDIFTDCKIPGRRRRVSLVVEDSEEILWLVGVTTSEKSRVAPDTDKIVRITVQPR